MKKAGSARADTGRAALALGRVIDETRALFHRLRLAAEQLHAADRLTAGERAILVELASQEPRTVPEMARARPVSRQHIQTLVNALLKRTLVTLAENPRHQRSKRVELTRVGRALAKRVKNHEKKTLTELGQELDPMGLEQAAQTLGHVRQMFTGNRFRERLEKRDRVSTRRKKSKRSEAD